MSASLSVVLLTPLSPGGIAAVRLFGPDAMERAGQLFQPRAAGEYPPSPGRLMLGSVIDAANGEPIDDAILGVLPGRLGVELNLHGGVRIVQRVIAACEQLGATRLDLLDPSHEPALWRQQVTLGRARAVRNPALWADVELVLPRIRTQRLTDWILSQYAGEHGLASLGGEPGAIAFSAESLLSDYPATRRAIEGLRVAIVGPPNAGKSTLLNAMVGAPTAIVSDTPGTTRDYVCRWVSLAGLPVQVSDTPGVREASDPLEAMALVLADPIVREADLRLIVLDRSAEPSPEELTRLAASISDRGGESSPDCLVVVNKSDLPCVWDVQAFARRVGAECVAMSAERGEGLDELSVAVTRKVWPMAFAERPAIFRDRQRDILAGGGAGGALLG